MATVSVGGSGSIGDDALTTRATSVTICPTRGHPLARDAFAARASPHGALFCASTQEIINKMLWEYEMSGHTSSWRRSGSADCPSMRRAARSSCW